MNGQGCRGNMAWGEIGGRAEHEWMLMMEQRGLRQDGRIDGVEQWQAFCRIKIRKFRILFLYNSIQSKKKKLKLKYKIAIPKLKNIKSKLAFRPFLVKATTTTKEKAKSSATQVFTTSVSHVWVTPYIIIISPPAGELNN